MIPGNRLQRTALAASAELQREPEGRINLQLKYLGELHYWIFARARERLGLETPGPESK